MRLLWGLLGIVLAAFPAWAQPLPSTARMGITPETTPEVLSVYDNSGTWATIGYVNAATHTFASWLSYNIDPRSYGAKCDGAAHPGDDQAWASLTAAVVAGSSVLVPGQCVFTAPIVFPPAANLTLYSPGLGGALIYSGASTINDLIVFGSATALDGQHCSMHGLKIRNVLFQSTVTMTGGDALHIKYACDSDLTGNMLGGEWTGGNHFWNALHLDGGNSVRTTGGSINGINTGVLINGDSTTQFTDPYFFHVKVTYATYGFNIAGNVGGFQMVESALISNHTHVRISQDRVTVPNLQIFLSGTLDVTPSGGVGVDLADPGTTNSLLMVNRIWLGSAANQCLLIEPSANKWSVTFQGGYVINCNNTAVAAAMIDNQSTSTGVSVEFMGTQFSQCCNGGKVVINNQTGNLPIRLTGASFATSTGARFSGPISGTWNDGANIFTNANATSVVLQGAGTSATNCGAQYYQTFFEPAKMDGSGAGCVINLGSGAAPWNDVQSLQGHFFDTSTSSTASVVASAVNDTNGINVHLIGNGSTTPSKYLRVNNGGLQILNDGYTASLITLDDLGNLKAAKTVQAGGFSIATLPACTGTSQGQVAWVTNGQASPTYLGAVSTTGTTIAPVFCNGAGWVYH